MEALGAAVAATSGEPPACGLVVLVKGDGLGGARHWEALDGLVAGDAAAVRGLCEACGVLVDAPAPVRKFSRKLDEISESPV